VFLQGRGEQLDLSFTQVPPAQNRQGVTKSSFYIAMFCTIRRRIPASASTNQGPGKADFGWWGEQLDLSFTQVPPALFLLMTFGKSTPRQNRQLII
jgi:hypothetical protein